MHMSANFNEKRSLTHALRSMTEWAIAAATSFAAASCLLAQVPGYTITKAVGISSNTTLVLITGIAIDSAGNLYIATVNNVAGPYGVGTIRKVSPGGVISTVAGGGAPTGSSGDGGPATSTTLFGPAGIALDSSGNLFIAEAGGNRIRKVSTNGTITTVAGPGSTNGALGDGGPATGATLSFPSGLALDSVGNVFVADTGHNRIRKVSLDGTITTVAGNGSILTGLGDGGPATGATVSVPTGLAVDTAGNLFIADYGHDRIRKVSPSGIITTVAGTGVSTYSGDGGLASLAGISGSTAVAPPVPLF
jgi:sugar lactone lactonase YvrE